MCLSDLLFGQSRITTEEERPNLIAPDQVYDFLVRENGIGGRTAIAHQNNKKKRCHRDRK
jgi:hypothetical protein